MHKLLEQPPIQHSKFTIYDCNVYTVYETMVILSKKMNEGIDVINAMKEYLLFLKNEGISIEVVAKLENWLSDGTLSDLINHTIFEDLNTKITTVENSLLTGFINVKYPPHPFTPVIGNGVDDDFNNIQTLLNFAETNKGVKLYFPKSTYMISKTLEVLENTHLVLDDLAIIRRISDGNLLQNGRIGGNTQYSNITIEGGKWDLDNNHVTYKGAVHFTIGNCENIIIKNCTFLNNHGNHALDLGGVKNIIIDNCNFKGFIPNPSGDRNYVEAIQISEFTAQGQPTFGGGFNGNPCENVIIKNCKFDKSDNTLYGYYPCGIGHHLAEERKNKDIFIENCIFNNCSIFAIRPYAFKNTIIKDCTFNNCVEGIHITNIGKMELSSQNKDNRINEDILIENCTFKNTTKNDIWCKGKIYVEQDVTLNKAYSKNININNCIFTRESELFNTYPSSLYMELVDGLNITNCTFENCERGLFGKGINNVNITGTNINNASTEFIYITNLMYSDIKLMNTNVNINNNILDTSLMTGIFCNSVLTVNVNNNTILNASSYGDNHRNAITVSDGSNNGVVLGNIVPIGKQKYGIEITPTCTNIIEGVNNVKGITGDIVNNSK